MIKIKYILFVLAMCLSLSMRGQDTQRLSETDILGTARFVGMAGAMTAVGGDPSAVVMNNPAALGVYKRFEAMFAFDVQIDRTRQSGLKTQGQSNCIPTLASINFHWDGVFNPNISHNLMVSYQRLKSWNRTYAAAGSSVWNGNPSSRTASLTRIMAQNADGLDETAFDDPYGSWWEDENIGWLSGMGYWDSLISANSSNTYYALPNDDEAITNSYSSEVYGSFNQYGLTYGININSRWYVGLGLNILSYNYHRNTTYTEFFGLGGSMTLANNLFLSGAGVNGSIGIIGRPHRWLRVGASFQTPSSVTSNTSQRGVLSADFSETQYYEIGIPDEDFYPVKEIDYSLPMKSSVGMAFQFKTHGLVSLQYDYMHWKDMPDVHTLRIGGEYVLRNQLYFNAGYAFKSNFGGSYSYGLSLTSMRVDADFENMKYTQNACLGFGFRGRYFMAQMAYQLCLQKEDIFAFETAEPYRMTNRTSHIVFTLGVHL